VKIFHACMYDENFGQKTSVIGSKVYEEIGLVRGFPATHKLGYPATHTHIALRYLNSREMAAHGDR